jgi:hypothetical protein
MASQTRCTICHTLIRETDETMECEVCRSTYHAQCWTDLGGCATYGCEKAPVAEKPPTDAAGVGWGDSKACPACGRELHPAALDCSCRAAFPHADPMTPDEYRRWIGDRKRARERRATLATLFGISLLGFTAPVTGLIAGGLAWSWRRDLAGGEGTFLALGYGAGALGVLYSILILFLVAGG